MAFNFEVDMSAPIHPGNGSSGVNIRFRCKAGNPRRERLQSLVTTGDRPSLINQFGYEGRNI